jgi:hypothetical protein
MRSFMNTLCIVFRLRLLIALSIAIPYLTTSAQSTPPKEGQPPTVDDQGKHPHAQQAAEKALEIHRRLLTDDHPETAASYDKLAANLQAQGNTLRLNHCTRRRWKYVADCSPTTIPTRPPATTAWRAT